MTWHRATYMQEQAVVMEPEEREVAALLQSLDCVGSMRRGRRIGRGQRGRREAVIEDREGRKEHMTAVILKAFKHMQETHSCTDQDSSRLSSPASDGAHVPSKVYTFVSLQYRLWVYVRRTTSHA